MINLKHYYLTWIAKPSQKERILNKFIEDSIYVLVSNRYFLAIANGFIKDPIEIPMITTSQDVGAIMNPDEVSEIFRFRKI